MSDYYQPIGDELHNPPDSLVLPEHPIFTSNDEQRSNEETENPFWNPHKSRPERKPYK